MTFQIEINSKRVFFILQSEILYTHFIKVFHFILEKKINLILKRKTIKYQNQNIHLNFSKCTLPKNRTWI